MINFTRPILAASLLKPSDKHDNETIFNAMSRLKYPVLASLKLDGIRGIKLNTLVSRTLKPIPNKSIRDRAMKLPAGFDVELFNPTLQYNEIESIVMSEEHPNSDIIQFHILDCFTAPENYIGRIRKLDLFAKEVFPEWKDVKYESPILWQSPVGLFGYFKQIEEENGEGICFRTLNSPYKQGRSTLKEQYLVKLARFQRTECVITGFTEQLLNYNTKKTSLLGLTERSSQKSRMLGKNTLGSLIVKNNSGIAFSVGTGFDDNIRREIWDNQDKYLGTTVVIKHKGFGQKIKPRCPSFVGFRKDIDII